MLVKKIVHKTEAWSAKERAHKEWQMYYQALRIAEKHGSRLVELRMTWNDTTLTGIMTAQEEVPNVSVSPEHA